MGLVITFNNKSNEDVVIQIGGKTSVEVLSHATVTIPIIANAVNLEIKVRQRKTSYFDKKGFNKRYRLTIESSYFVHDISDNMVFDITREIIRVSGNIYYEKVHLKHSTYINIHERNIVCDLESINKVFRKRHLIYSLFISPIEHLTWLCVPMLLFGIVLFCKLGIYYAILFVVFSYAFILLLDLIIKKVCDFFFNKTLGIENDKLEFNMFTNNDYVSEFFCNPNRIAYMNDLKKEES